MGAGRSAAAANARDHRWRCSGRLHGCLEWTATAPLPVREFRVVGKWRIPGCRIDLCAPCARGLDRPPTRRGSVVAGDSHGDRSQEEWLNVASPASPARPPPEPSILRPASRAGLRGVRALPSVGRPVRRVRRELADPEHGGSRLVQLAILPCSRTTLDPGEKGRGPRHHECILP